MKLLQLIGSRVRQYWIHNRLIFLLFLVGGILSAVMFSYFYGNTLTYMSYRTAQDRTDRTYEVSAEGMLIPLNSVDQLYENDLVESVQVSFLYNEHPGGADLIEGASIVSLKVAAAVGNDIHVRCRIGTADLNTNPDGVVVDDYSAKTVGDTIVIAGRTFPVIGKHLLYGYYISYDTFRELELPVDKVNVVAKELHDFGNDPVRALLEELFPGCVIDAPAEYEAAANRDSVAWLSIVCAVYGAAMLSYMFLLRFLMDANLNATIVSRIVGAGKWQVLGMCFWEAVALCSVANLSGIAIHWALYDSVFSKLNKVEGMVYLPQDYLWIFLAMLCVGMAVALCFVMKYALLSPAASRRYAE